MGCGIGILASGLISEGLWVNPQAPGPVSPLLREAQNSSFPGWTEAQTGKWLWKHFTGWSVTCCYWAQFQSWNMAATNGICQHHRPRPPSGDGASPMLCVLEMEGKTLHQKGTVVWKQTHNTPKSTPALSSTWSDWPPNPRAWLSSQIDVSQSVYTQTHAATTEREKTHNSQNVI